MMQPGKPEVKKSSHLELQYLSKHSGWLRFAMGTPISLAEAEEWLAKAETEFDGEKLRVAEVLSIETVVPYVKEEVHA